MVKEIAFMIMFIVVFAMIEYATLEAFNVMTTIEVNGKKVSVVSKATLSILYILLIIYVMLFFASITLIFIGPHLRTCSNQPLLVL